MFKLTSKLAVSNLIKNRRLYYPFALATCLAVAISYIFNSLTFNPNLTKMTGASTIAFVLVLGIIVVTISVGIIVFYANSFVMKNRSKELGLYGMLGLNKRHLFNMVFVELFLFGLVIVAMGLGLGVLFDNLIYAFLLKLMGAKVVLVSTFQMPVLISVIVIYGFIFAGLVLVNGWRILRLAPLQLAKETNSGEKKGRFLPLQTILGLLSLGAGYYLAQIVENPMTAITIFFLAVLLVILGTYLLFNAGITVFLKMLQKRKNYYYQPNNMISVSNLIFRMKKNAVGLASISILSTMVLVTLTGGANIFAGAEYLQKAMFPSDFSLIANYGGQPEQLEQILTEFVAENQLKVKKQHIYQSYLLGIQKQVGNDFQLYSKGQRSVVPESYMMIFSAADYKQMTGKDLQLTGNQAAVYSKGISFDDQRPLDLSGLKLDVKQVLQEDFVLGKVTDQYNIIIPKAVYLVVENPSQLLASHMENFQIDPQLFGALDIEASDQRKEELDQVLHDKVNASNQSLPEGASGAYAQSRLAGMKETNGMVGGFFFIGIFLSIVFMLGTVLVIYYKQISEGYEDRDRFVILQKVGLDEQQVKQTIRKQILTVFFLPLIFAFIHLAFAYHMLSLILQIMGVLNAGLMLAVTLGICAVFLLVYVGVFLLTSRSYRRIVAM